jgi:hypothetical protein
MKNAANCEKYCELQDTLIIDDLNAHCGSGTIPEPRLSEGRKKPIKKHFVVRCLYVTDRFGCPLGGDGVWCTKGRPRVFPGFGSGYTAAPARPFTFSLRGVLAVLDPFYTKSRMVSPGCHPCAYLL